MADLLSDQELAEMEDNLAYGEELVLSPTEGARILGHITALRADRDARAEVLPDDTVCACFHEMGHSQSRLYERCERCGVFTEASYLVEQLERAEADRDTLALYAEHRATCRADKGHGFECTCGLDGLLGRLSVGTDT